MQQNGIDIFTHNAKQAETMHTFFFLQYNTVYTAESHVNTGRYYLKYNTVYS